MSTAAVTCPQASTIKSLSHPTLLPGGGEGSSLDRIGSRDTVNHPIKEKLLGSFDRVAGFVLNVLQLRRNIDD